MRRAGFTLIELMVAITVLVAVISIVFVCFASVTDTAAVARANTERMHLEQFLWRHLSTTVESVYADSACEEPSFALQSVDEEGPYGPADSLTFCASLSMDGPLALPGVFKKVSYEVTEPDADEATATEGTVLDDTVAEEEGPRLVLRITEQPLVLSEFSAIQESEEHVEMEELDELQQYTQVREIPVASFDLAFYDGQDWIETWDSLMNGTMPWAIRFRANFPRTNEEMSADINAGFDFQDEADLDLTITLPVGAGVMSSWIDMNHARNAGAQVPVDENGQPLEPGAGEGDGTGGSKPGASSNADGRSGAT